MAIDKSLVVSTPIHNHGDRPEVDDKVSTGTGSSEHESTTHACDKNRGLPIDRGWAWVVLAGSMFYLILFGGIKKNLGIFFVAYQDRFHSSASLTSALTTMQNVFISVSSLVVMTIGMQYMSNRTAIMCGSVCLTVSYIITAYATDINILFISVGFLEGIGTAMIHPTVTATLGEYFQKRRGFANGIAFSAASCGGLIFAPIMSALFENYGYTGSCLIVAGMMFNIMITGVLLRPIKSFEVREPEERFETENVKLLTSGNSGEKRIGKVAVEDINESEEILKQLAMGTEHQNKVFVPNKAILKIKMDAPPSVKIVRSDSYSPDNKTIQTEKSLSPLLPRARAWSESSRRKRTVSGNSQLSHIELSPLNSIVESLSRSKVALYASADGICGSVIEIQEICMTKEQNGPKPTWLTKMKDSFEISSFKNPVFPVFLFMAAMFAPSMGLLPAFLAPLARDQGISNEQAGLLMSIVGGVGVFSRIACALLADRKFIKLTTLIAIMSTIIGIVAHCIRFFNSFWSLVFVAVMLEI
ncbi:hypothetical protein ACF0H5_020585 [Mactra antiquata]